jgi:hypothetical protein
MKEREVTQMALIVNGIIYDILVLNVARSFGLESEEVMNFYNFVLNAENDEEIQKEYIRVMGVTE